MFPSAQRPKVFCENVHSIFISRTSRRVLEIMFGCSDVTVSHACSLWHDVCVQLQDKITSKFTDEWLRRAMRCLCAHLTETCCRETKVLGERLTLLSWPTTSTIILPRGSLSASMSRNTTGFSAGPEENSLAAASPSELYLTRVLSCNIAARRTGCRGAAEELQAAGVLRGVLRGVPVTSARRSCSAAPPRGGCSPARSARLSFFNAHVLY